MCDFVNGKKVCFDHWYGDNCTKPCLAHDDAMGHYVCDNKTGDIICLPGWRNESINCTDGKLFIKIKHLSKAFLMYT